MVNAKEIMNNSFFFFLNKKKVKDSMLYWSLIDSINLHHLQKFDMEDFTLAVLPKSSANAGS